MTRKLLLSLSLLSAGMCLAAPLSPEEALNRLNGGLLSPATRGSAALKPAMVLSTPVGEPAIYVFNQTETPGFMVVSADDAVTPLLGYSDFNSFDPDNIPPALQNWLDQYSQQIEYARSTNSVASSEPNTRVSLPAWSAIAPMVKTAWNQGAPYNNLCPLQGNSRTYTGCVATAMSQVMNYFKYPEKGQGSITYKCESINQNLSLDFSDITFDWANMLNTYSGTSDPAVSQEAVATLMMAAGYSVQMSYSTNQSGAISGYIPGALVKYFNYDKGVLYVSRSQKTYTEWATLIYNNLKNVGPVIYDGDTDFSGGHSFVCDGYNGNGYFHFNWGWGGSGDGYFLLDSLNPSSIGIGGALGGFNFRQDAVLNIQKPKSGSEVQQNEIVLSGSVEGYVSSSYLNLKIYGSSYPGYRYYGLDEMTFDVGISIVPANEPNATPNYVVSANNSNFQKYFMPLDPGYILYCSGQAGYPYPMFSLSKLDLNDGVKYKVTAVYRPEGGDWMVADCDNGSYNYFNVTKNGSNYEFENFPQMQFTCDNLTLGSELYDGTAVKVDLSLVNKNDTELTRGVTLLLLDAADNIAFVSDSFVETLSANESFNKEWVTNLINQSSTTIKKATDYYLALYDIDTDTYYYKATTPVTMQPSLGAPDYTCVLTIDNGKILNYPEYTVDIYEVENAQDIQATVKIDVTKGIFSYPINIYGGVEDNRGNIIPEMTYPLDIQIIDAGETGTYNVNVNFASAEINKVYFLIADVNSDYNIIEGKDDIIGFVALNNEAGVESLIGNSSDIIMLYNRITGKLIVRGGANGIRDISTYSLNGSRLSSSVNYSGDNAEVDLSTLGKGIVVVTATDRKGHRKTMKLAL